MEKRIKEIVGKFTTFKKEKYHKDEVIAEMFKLQEEMVKETFNEVHAEKGNLHLWDIEKHFSQMNESCGNVASELVESFNTQAKEFCEIIRAELSGRKGEAKAYKSLQTINRKHKILRNIELKSDDHRTELDFVIITNSGVYIVEVKNTSKNILIDEKGNFYRETSFGELVLNDNIGEKMNEKEYLLRQALKGAKIEDFPLHSIVVFTNSVINVKNDYKYINECYLSQLPHIINNNVEMVFDDKKINKIEQAILEAQCKEEYYIEFDIVQFKNTFATLLATLEDAKVKQAEIERVQTRVNKSWVVKFFRPIARLSSFIFK